MHWQMKSETARDKWYTVVATTVDPCLEAIREMHGLKESDSNVDRNVILTGHGMIDPRGSHEGDPGFNLDIHFAEEPSANLRCSGATPCGHQLLNKEYFVASTNLTSLCLGSVW